MWLRQGEGERKRGRREKERERAREGRRKGENDLPCMWKMMLWNFFQSDSSYLDYEEEVSLHIFVNHIEVGYSLTLTQHLLILLQGGKGANMCACS